VIPSLAEGDSLLATLGSVAAGPEEHLARFLVIVVVNHREDAPAAIRDCNRQDLQALGRLGDRSGLKLAWVDAASPGRELPLRGGGVGMARKIGLDLALSRLDWSQVPLLVFLDADTLVEPGYLPAIEAHFAKTVAGAAALPFQHQRAPDPEHQRAIDRYELFVRSYALGLARAGSPYAFTPIGSAIACRAATYVRCGGMNRRAAGEDFYFLQQAAKTDGVAALSGTRVYPSSRVSRRTPFGTGMSVAQQILGNATPLLFYPAAVFQVLEAWLATVANSKQADSKALWSGAAEASPVLVDFLEECALESFWQGIRRNHTSHPERLRAFHAWFDGLKTLRLVHRLCERDFVRQTPEQALPELLAWCGQSAPENSGEILKLLRNCQEKTVLF
jgi:hypothetical protein